MVVERMSNTFKKNNTFCILNISRYQQLSDYGVSSTTFELKHFHGNWLTFFFLVFGIGIALQIQCYQCEEINQNDCSTPEYIVNCTVNVQDTCQKEVLVKPDGKPGIILRGALVLPANLGS